MLNKLFYKFFMAVFLLGSFVLTACEDDIVVPGKDTPPPTEGEKETRIVSGTVKDTRGRPVAGASVRIENDWSYYDVTTNEQGKYTSPKLPPGGFKVLAWATMTYKGQEYTLRMGMPQPSDYDYFDPEDGVSRNFEWKISGRIPDREPGDGSGYFGATLEFMNGTGSIYDERMNPGDQVRFTLDPTGPLIDGSTGTRIERTITIKSGNDSYILTDIPTGEYVLSATRITPEGYQEQVLTGSFSEQWESTIIVFQPGTYGTGTYESGVQRLSLFMNLNR